MQRPNDVNDAQWQAIIHPTQHVLIVAGPGTGKTHTLVYRVLCALENLSTSKRILAVTFTNKAAQEMRTRLRRFFPSFIERVDVGTFHHVCLSLLREHARKARLPDGFRVAGPGEKAKIARRIWKDKKPKEIEMILKTISWEKNTLANDTSSRAVMLREAMRQDKLLDFDDILMETLGLLRESKIAKEQIQQRYGLICVDEYQDINFIQHELLKLLKGPWCALTAIGDPQQAIYGFRGSDVKFFHAFIENFVPAQTLSLCDNYRSSPSLLKAASQIIERSCATSFTPIVSRIYAKGRLIIHQAASERAEAEYIVHQIEQLIGGTSFFSKDSRRVDAQEEGGFTFADIAILCRLNSQHPAIVEALERSGIPYQVFGARLLCEEPEIADIINDLCAMSEQPLEKIRQHLSCLKNESKAYARLVDLAGSTNSTSQLLSEIFLQREDHCYEAKAEKVSVLTMHAAKGLEFGAVFVAGCEKNIIPLSQDLVDIDEERRLFYVAMTRAKTLLYLTRSCQRFIFGKTRQMEESCFLKDIDQALKAYAKDKTRRLYKREKQGNLF